MGYVRRHVTIVQHMLPHYRAPFFSHLRDRLDDRGIGLELVHGQTIGAAAERSDATNLPWAHEISNMHFGPFVWQSAWRHSKDADLVIVEQASRLLLNYYLLAARALGGSRVAFWGHGANLQGDQSSLRERWKRLFIRTPDWWFAYTSGVADRVEARGYPRNRITVVQNAVDTGQLAKTHVPKKVGRCIYVGGLHKDKRPGFLIEAADVIAARVPHFELLVVGDGPLRGWLGDQSNDRAWLKLYGANHGHMRDELFASSQLTLMPGLVGLVVVDSFAARAPLVTTAEAAHSPEIEYLQDGVNGCIVPHASPVDYADAVTRILLTRHAVSFGMPGTANCTCTR